MPRDVAHLFTARHLEGNVAGCAFPGSLCTSFAYGVTNVFVVGPTATGNLLQASIVAYQLAHNAGAVPCGGADPSCDPKEGILPPVFTAPTLHFVAAVSSSMKAYLATLPCVQRMSFPNPADLQTASLGPRQHT